METVREAKVGMEGESAKRRRKEGNSSGKIDGESAPMEEIDGESAPTEEIDGESAPTEAVDGESVRSEEISEDDTSSEDETISEEEILKWSDIDREVFLEKVLSEEEKMDDYRKDWESIWADRFGCFEQETKLSSMATTRDTITTNGSTINAWAGPSLQVYSIKVERAKFMWPLHVYGMVAARDNVDHNRNLLFSRKRDNCQIITENDPYLLLTGPSRAIVALDPAVFEINLKVKGESEDKETLIHQIYSFNGTCAPRGRNCSNKLCKISFNFMMLEETVQATITSVQIISGSWPSQYAGEVFCHDGSSPEKVVLLDFPDGRYPPVDEADNLVLSRRVVSVNVHNKMTFTVRAYSVAGDKKITVGSGVQVFQPGRCGVTERQCDLGENCVLKIEVAWSLLVVFKTQFNS